jgi:flagellin-specific chaperone FliS
MTQAEIIDVLHARAIDDLARAISHLRLHGKARASARSELLASFRTESGNARALLYQLSRSVNRDTEVGRDLGKLYEKLVRWLDSAREKTNTRTIIKTQAVLRRLRSTWAKIAVQQ